MGEEENSERMQELPKLTQPLISEGQDGNPGIGSIAAFPVNTSQEWRLH